MSRIREFVPPLAESLLAEQNFFELYPYDGGGCFINHEILGTTDDRIAAHRMLHENALCDFGGVDAIDYLKFERWSTIEKSCWINRMYFIVPLARCYALTGDESLAAVAVAVLKRFMSEYAPKAPQDQPSAKALDERVLYVRDHDYNANASFDGPADYQWFDFQPASRIIHISYAAYFLRKSVHFTEEFQRQVDDLLRLHADCIWWVEAFGTPMAPGNHQALRALALLYAAVIFHGEPHAEEWRRTALALCNYHVLHDFMADGMLIDLSPSYHFFETWISRDAYILARRAGTPLSIAAEERVQQAFRLCSGFRQPDGLSPVISDGYALNMDIFLKSLPEIEETSASQSCLVLEAAKMAVWNHGGVFVLMDSSPLTSPLAHYHAGKQAVTLFLGGKPILADSGCCNYDDPDFAGWYKQPQAHSTLIINGQGDSLLEGRYHWLTAQTCTVSPWSGNTVESTMTSGMDAWRDCTWTRRLTVGDASLQIADCVCVPSAVSAELIFNLHPDVDVTRVSDMELQLRNGGVCVRMVCSAPLELRGGQGYVAFCKRLSKQVVVRNTGAALHFSTVFSLMKGLGDV